jgi:single-stranded DNA-specific DHH superfamily exonuclease
MAETVICISHGKDADGLVSASLVKAATGAQIVLADYGDFVEKMGAVKSVDHLYICDLGLNGTLAASFVKEIERIRGFASIHYIDHHPLDPALKENLKGFGVELTHSLEECASVLTYTTLKDQLHGSAAVLAAYGAITDYMDDTPLAKKIIARYDRQFVLLEATLLTYALIGGMEDQDLRDRIVTELSGMKFPHQIKGVIDASQRGLESTADLIRKVVEQGVTSGLIAHMEVTEGSSGTVANLLVGAFDVPVGIAYRLVKDEGVYEISLRGSYDSTYDLGKVVSQVTGMIGGSGGGHKKASGARISRSLLKDFLDLVEFEIDKVSAPHHRGFTRKP